MSALVDRMIAAGHTPKCDEDGEVDMFAIEHEYCNGPMCSVCGAGVCHHCRPDWQPEPCPGAEKVAADAKAKRHEKFLELKAEFDPD